MVTQTIDRVRRFGWQTIAAATSFVIAVSAFRGVRRGYQAIGDNALIELRARDVLTDNHPFLGTWSSASISSGIDVNHPGPLLFELVAIPVRLFGGAAGIAVAVATLQIAVVWLVGMVTARVGGADTAIPALVITAGLAWSMGSELLYDPWQPNVLVLPFWLVLCCVWAVVADEIGVLPLAVGAGSFVMQTHLGYAFIVPILLAFAIGSAMYRRRDRTTDRFTDLQQPLFRSVIVGGVLWAQPVWEQLFGTGQGNLTRLVIAGTGGGDGPKVESATPGLSLGIRMLGSVLTLPPWWGRSGYDDSIPPSTWVDGPDGRELLAPGLRSLGPSMIGLLVVGALVIVAWRHLSLIGAVDLVAGFRTLAVVFGVAAITVVITPIDALGLSPHKIRWLWVIGAFLTYMLLMAVVARFGAAQWRGTPILLVAIALGALALTLPSHANNSGPVLFRATYPSIEDIRNQLADYADGLDAPTDVLFDASGIGFGEPYTSAVIAELLANGIDVFVDDERFARQLGSDRLASPDEPQTGTSLIYVRVGSVAKETPPGAVRIAFHDGDPSPFSLNDVTDRAVAVFYIAEPI